MNLPIIDNCDDCGACCQHVGHPMWFRDEQEWIDLPAEMKGEHIRYLASIAGSDDYGEPCYWLDEATKKCKHHDLRPAVCKDFEIGGDDCRRIRTASEANMRDLRPWMLLTVALAALLWLWQWLT